MPRASSHVDKVWIAAATSLALALGLGLAPGLPPPAGAQVRVQFRTEPGGPGEQFAAQSGISLPDLQSQVERELTQLFQSSEGYLRSFGDAQSFTTRGMGVDYASNFKAVMVGVAGNLSLNAEKGYAPEGTRTEPPAAGVAPNLTLMAGVNLNLLGIAPISLYANYFNRSGELGDFSAELSNFGVHAQLKLFGPDEGGLMDALVQWGGLDITTGFERSRLGLTLAQGFRRNIPLSAPGQSSGMALMDVNTVGQFSIESRTLSVPLELTTNFRLLYLLSVYGGLGIDWQLGGGSDMTVALQGNMVGVTPAAGGQPSMRIDVGTANIDATQSVDPSAGRLRWLLGLQVNVLIVRLFVQLNLVTQDPVLASVALGARIAF